MEICCAGRTGSFNSDVLAPQLGKNRARLFTALHLGRYFTQGYLEKAKIPSENATRMNTPNYAAF